jgi:hypothetical protein
VVVIRAPRDSAWVHHVVAVADEHQAQAVEPAAALDEGEAVAQDLARVQEVRQAVDHRHRGVGGELDQGFVGEGAGHDQVDEAIEIAGDVGDGLALAELDVVRRQVHSLAAELRHADLEGHAGAQARLLEDHRQRLAGEQGGALAGLEVALELRRQLQDLVDLGAAEPGEGEEVALHAASTRPRAPRRPPRPSRSAVA